MLHNNCSSSEMFFYSILKGKSLPVSSGIYSRQNRISVGIIQLPFLTLLSLLREQDRLSLSETPPTLLKVSSSSTRRKLDTIVLMKQLLKHVSCLCQIKQYCFLFLFFYIYHCWEDELLRYVLTRTTLLHQNHRD